MSNITEIKQTIELGNDDILIISSNPNSIITTINYREKKTYLNNKTEVFSHLFAFNKMDFLKLGEEGDFGKTSRDIVSDDFYQNQYLRVRMNLKFTMMASTGDIIIDRKHINITNKPHMITEISDKVICQKILDAFRIYRSRIKINYNQYKILYNELSTLGFNDDVIKFICFRISNCSEKIIQDILSSIDGDNFVFSLHKYKILDPTKFSVILFIMRYHRGIIANNVLKANKISTIKDIQNYLLTKERLSEIEGLGLKTEETIMKSIKSFLHYCI